MVSQSSIGWFISVIFFTASGVLVWIGRMISSLFLSSMYTVVDSFRPRFFLIFAGIEILPNLSILAILCIMPCCGLLGLRFLSAVVGLRMEFSSRPRTPLHSVQGIFLNARFFSKSRHKIFSNSILWNFIL